MPIPKTQISTIRRVFMYLATFGAVLLVAFGCVALWAHNFVSGMVSSQLAAQKIYFPEKGDANFSAQTYPDLQQYAGQLVDSPEKAEAFANGYIGRHLKQIGGGRTYSEISAEAMADPDNATLQQQKQTLFQGETLRGMLLTSGYGFGTIGEIAGLVTYIAFGLGLVSLAFALSLWVRLRA